MLLWIDYVLYVFAFSSIAVHELPSLHQCSVAEAAEWVKQRCNHVGIGHHVTLHLTSFALIGFYCVRSQNPKKQNEAITKKPSVTKSVFSLHMHLFQKGSRGLILM